MTMFLRRSLLPCAVALTLSPQVVSAEPSAAGSAPIAYTEIADGTQARFPGGTRRLALLIGNDAYDKALKNPSIPYAAPLRPLKNGCSDARALAAKLAAMGWNKPEIVVLCDQTAPQIDTAMRAFIDQAPLDKEDKKLMVVYLAGHGVHVDGRDYFMGVNALPDYDRIVRSLVDVRAGGEKRPIFNNQGVNVHSIFTDEEALGNQMIQFPLLLIFDTCRNNPIAEMIETRYADYLRKHPPQTQSQMREILAVSGTRKVTGVPTGMLVLFATPVGNTIDDDAGEGASRLGAALQRDAKADVEIDHIIQSMALRFHDDNRHLQPGKQQKLDKEGDLFVDPEHGDWCLGGCALPGGDEVTKLPARTPLRHFSLRSPLSWPADAGGYLHSALAAAGPIAQATDAATAATEAPRKSRVVYRSEVAEGLRPMTLDVFWCEGDDQAADRYERANALALRIRDDFAGTSFGGSRFGTVRLRRLDRETNQRAGYQRNDDSIYIDANDSDERAAATRIAAGAKLRLASVRRDTPGYVSAFFCQAAYAGPRAPTLYVQVPSAQSLATASDVIEHLDRKFSDVAVERKAEVVEVSPQNSELRYFSAKYRPQAQAMADSLAGMLGHPVKAVNLCEKVAGCANADKRHLEFWLGLRDAGKTAVDDDASHDKPRD